MPGLVLEARADVKAEIARTDQKASLLLAFPDAPLRVQGRLMPPAREHSHYRTFVEHDLC